MSFSARAALVANPVVHPPGAAVCHDTPDLSTSTHPECCDGYIQQLLYVVLLSLFVLHGRGAS